MKALQWWPDLTVGSTIVSGSKGTKKMNEKFSTSNEALSVKSKLT